MFMNIGNSNYHK